ncbi:class I SAM-dependent methyltransferase [Pantoea dispersa]|uniref:class I SAM-dependent methyltransferase n=1 Tax=Pantoea dispersa TaxID=59814 RepID=UPI0021B07422|nr:class I SAM-dependent methyltransferase [Pantoea dispersa]MCT6590820.1 class I SAM-dependent methyltransferase [Pantoea dispersa]
MKSEFISYLNKNNINDPFLVDRLIVSSFFKRNNIKKIKNKLINKYIIKTDNNKENLLLNNLCEIIDREIIDFDIEQLINLFEFVVSPSDRVINGAVYTPKKIRDYITKNALISYPDLDCLKISDISCGCGGFLYDASIYLKKHTTKKYKDIFEQNIFGIDIQDFSATRSKILLSILAIMNDEDDYHFNFNIFVGDSLDFDWKTVVDSFIGFDVIIGNPPYVCSRNLSVETKSKVSKWSVSGSGHPDLYIPFFQIGIELLKENGTLGYITMNSFFKSVNGRALRDYLNNKRYILKIIDFGTEQLFESRNTYTCICMFKKKKSESIFYFRTKSNVLPCQKSEFELIKYDSLNHHNGWNLHLNQLMHKIESEGVPFGSIFKIKHGIATLKNDVYIFSPQHEDEKYYYLEKYPTHKIEKSICRDIINSNKITSNTPLDEIKEKIIFPYHYKEKLKPSIFTEEYFIKNYPNAYQYLVHHKKNLTLRDKGKKEYPAWFAFGRAQSLETIKNKLLLPRMSNKPPHSILSMDDDVLFYNGIAITASKKSDLLLAQKILSSRLFWKYITTTSKPYGSDYYALNGSFVNTFGVYKFSKDDIKFILAANSDETLNLYMENLYNIFWN